MQIHNVTIQGYSLRIKTEHDLETLEVLKSEVEQKIKKILENHPSLSLQKALLLACLHLSEAKFLLKKEVYKDLDQLDLKAQDILRDLESHSTPMELEKAQSL